LTFWDVDAFALNAAPVSAMLKTKENFLMVRIKWFPIIISWQKPTFCEAREVPASTLLRPSAQ
jgi:hypothetical protein